MAYNTPPDFDAFDTLTAAELDILGGNDEALHNGTALPSADSDADYVATSQTTTSTSYTDLSTVQSVTVDVGSTGLLLVGYGARTLNDTAAAFTFMAPALSGANTNAASDNYAYKHQSTSANAEGRAGATKLYQGLSPGATTVTIKFRVETGGGGSGTGTWALRELWAIPL